MIFIPISAAIVTYVFCRAFVDTCLVYSNGFESSLLIVEACGA